MPNVKQMVRDRRISKAEMALHQDCVARWALREELDHHGITKHGADAHHEHAVQVVDALWEEFS